MRISQEEVESDLILTMFTSTECSPSGKYSLLIGRYSTILSSDWFSSSEVCCSRNSWLAQSNHNHHGLVTVQKFGDTVNNCRDLEIVIDEDDLPSEEVKSDRFKAAVKYHLSGLVVRESGVIPFNYFGSVVSIQFSVENVEDISHALNNMRLNSVGDTLITSTPQKHSSNMKKNLSRIFRISSNTHLMFPSPGSVEKSSPRVVGGLGQEMQTISSHARAELLSPGHKRMVTGILLHGPSGTGKTVLAESLPHSLGVSMVRVTGPEIFSKFFGETEQRLRDKFDEAKSSSPAILFIDEIDSLAPR